MLNYFDLKINDTEFFQYLIIEKTEAIEIVQVFNI
jgi:hypothetical protein